MKHMTVRKIPPDVAEALDREKHQRQTSLNQTVIDLLRQALGVGPERSNGLAALAGDWSDEELAEFERVTAPFDQIDDEIWR